MMEKELNVVERGLAFFRKNSMIIILVAIMFTFEYLTGGLLMKPLNITNLFLQNSYILVLAIGMLILIVLNQIDLSVGSIVAIVGAIAGTMMTVKGYPVWITVITAIVIGALIGAMQGFWVAIVGVPAFIVTLGGQLLFRGLTMFTLKGKTIAPLPQSFQMFSSKFLPEFLPPIAGLKPNALIVGLIAILYMIFANLNARKKKIKYEIEVENTIRFILKNIALGFVIIGFAYILARHNGIPNILVILLAVTIFYHFIMSSTKIGRHIYATGGNRSAATLSGIESKKITLLAFVNMGVLAAISGLIFASRLNAATPQAGMSFELDAIASCYIGGASASGGVGKVTGAIVGGFVMAMLNNGMSLMGVGIDIQQAIKGLVLLLAVALDVYNRSKAH